MSAVAIDGLDDGLVVFEGFGDGVPSGVVGGAARGGECYGSETEDAFAHGLENRDVLNAVEGRLEVPAAEDSR